MTTQWRTERVRPGMCGHNSLFAGQIGDWTWDAVGRACGTDVLRARDAAGADTYLSFYYYRIRGSRRFHPRTPEFGDNLQLSSRVFDFGSESVLTLHRITQAAPGAAGPQAELEPEKFYAFDDPDSLYVENFNRWITRSAKGSNVGLLRASPPDFRHEHLPVLPEQFSPRPAYARARRELSFTAHQSRPARTIEAEYQIDPTRDLNGVGLLYFAAYFSIVDGALLGLWRALGRDDRSFLARVVTDQRLLYLGNADSGATLASTVRYWPGVPGPAGEPGEDVDVVLRELGTGRLLAVCSLHLETGEPG